MAKTTKKQDVTPVVTRAEKKDATKNLIREFLQKQQYKHNDLIDEVAKAYTERFRGEDTENINDVKGRVGSVLDIMKKDGDVTFEKGVYAMKVEEKPKKTTRKSKKTVESTAEATPIETIEEKPKKTVKKTKKTTQKEFGELLNVSTAVITSYELGHATPPPATMRLICKTFNVRQQWLEEGVEPMFVPEAEDDQIIEEAFAQRSDFVKAMFRAITKTPGGWELMEQLAENIAKEMQTKQ